MKTKLLTLFILVTVIALAAPIPARAYSGVRIEVRDNKTNDFWSWGGDVYVYDNTSSTLLAGPVALPAAALTISYNVAPSMNDSITIYVITDPGPEGSPGVLSHTYSELSFVPGVYPAPTIQTGTGPTSLDLVNFTVNSQTNASPWLPYILLVGSVILVSGAVTLLRKRRA